MSSERTTRPCDVCGQQDDHPRHVGMITRDGVIQPLMRHLDCCAESPGGCPDGSCRQALAQAGSARGEGLVRFLTGGQGSNG